MKFWKQHHTRTCTRALVLFPLSRVKKKGAGQFADGPFTKSGPREKPKQVVAGNMTGAKQLPGQKPRIAQGKASKKITKEKKSRAHRANISLSGKIAKQSCFSPQSHKHGNREGSPSGLTARAYMNAKLFSANPRKKKL